ncbi:MAG: deoxyribonuclease-1 [Oceanospirillaceae bacterium]|jgi:deoxyribonuclease-1
MIIGEKSDFGSCEMIIDNKKAQPPGIARGRIARAYLYIDQAYSKFTLSKQQMRLITSWDKQYPVTEKECSRAKIIAKVQGNVNSVFKSRCIKL